MVKDENGLQSISEIRPTVIKPRRKQLSRIKERLVSLPLDEKQASILYQHTILCQTSMPYRNPGAAIRTWQRRNGAVRLLIQAGQVLDPSIGDFVEMGLPFGTKPRLVLYHLNAEALRTQSPVVELEDSLTAFVSRTLGLDPKGRNIRTVKEQLSRLAGADFRLGISRDGRAITIKGTVIKGLELWSPRNPRQKTLWPTIIQFSSDYFESLMQHAVPLNEDAVTRLSHSAMGLDVYTWLAQRLHRVHPGKPAFIPWVSLQEQFGAGYARMDNFKRVFRTTLKQVCVVYGEAKINLDGKGMRLYHCLPPVLKRYRLPSGR